MVNFTLDLNFKEFKETTLGYRYQRDPDNKDDKYFYQLVPSVVYGWINDDLSRESIALLLLFSSAIKEDFPWDVRWGQFKSPVYPTETELKKAYAELFEKGYMVRDGKSVYLRNDKRVDFPNGLTASKPAPVSSSSLGNEQKEENNNEDYEEKVWERRRLYELTNNEFFTEVDALKEIEEERKFKPWKK